MGGTRAMANAYTEQLATEGGGECMLEIDSEQRAPKFTRKSFLIAAVLLCVGAFFATRSVGQATVADMDEVVTEASAGSYSWCGSYMSCRTHGGKSKCEKACKSSGQCTEDAVKECDRKRTYGEKKRCKKTIFNYDDIRNDCIP